MANRGTPTRIPFLSGSAAHRGNILVLLDGVGGGKMATFNNTEGKEGEGDLIPPTPHYESIIRHN